MNRYTDLRNKAVTSSDGELGMLKDLYVADRGFHIHYLVVDCNKWLPDTDVLLSPAVIKAWSDKEGAIAVHLSREQIEASPKADLAKPISRLFEESLHDHFGWQPYWRDAKESGLTASLRRHGSSATPWETTAGEADRVDASECLHSTEVLRNYNIECNDGQFGKVEDFIIDEVTCSISDIVVNSHRWLPGGKTVALPNFVFDYIDISNETFGLSFSKEQVVGAPAYKWENFSDSPQRLEASQYFADAYNPRHRAV